MEIRTLHSGEREALLALLDGWELADGWRGRDFFRRYLEDDPSYADENVLVAAEGGALLSCVQIFPREIRVAGSAVACGGIGSVFTAPAARRRGIADAVFARSIEALRERGLPIGLLFGEERIYARNGWRAWGVPVGLLQRKALDGLPAGQPGVETSAFAESRDLAAVQSLHARYGELLSGCVVRDARLWQASLRTAGNPDEEFLVARAGGELVAYLRAALLYGFVTLTEFAAEPGFEPALASLVAQVMTPREGDTWERSGRRSDSLRSLAVSVPLGFAPDLAAALARGGISWRAAGDSKAMLCCLDPLALAARTGERPRAGEDPNDFLARLLPAEQLTFWPADRF